MATDATGKAERAGKGDVDLAALAERLFATRLAQFGWFLAFALLTRVSTFGDPNYHNDELLFFLIGQRMHEGLLPYVDLWDRKGPGLFLVYGLIGFLPASVVSYQATACLFAAATAFTAQRIAARFTGRLGAMLGGTLYLVLLPLFAGGGGQAPVFYNLFVALAALGVVTALPALAQGNTGRVVFLAMLSAGFAITFKQTAIAESCFLGLFVLWQLHRGGATLSHLATIAWKLALAGAAPMLLFAALYGLAGHFSEFWHAMVTSNLVKPSDPAGDQSERIVALATILAPALLPAVIGVATIADGRQRAFLAGWLAAAALGVALVPNYIDHYVLPLTLPVSVAAARGFALRRVGAGYGYAIILFGLIAGPALHFADRDASRQSMEAVAADIRTMGPHPRLFVFQGPVHLYTMFDSHPPTPLLFPMHLSYRPERNTSHLDTAGEVRRLLAWRPSVVVTAERFPGGFENPETASLVAAYLPRCRSRVVREIIDYYGRQKIAIHGHCA